MGTKCIPPVHYGCVDLLKKRRIERVLPFISNAFRVAPTTVSRDGPEATGGYDAGIAQSLAVSTVEDSPVSSARTDRVANNSHGDVPPTPFRRTFTYFVVFSCSFSFCSLRALRFYYY